MGNLTHLGTSPFDILFKDFFKAEENFTPFDQIKVNHPVDIYEANDSLNIDIACVGLTKEDINVTIEGDVLRVETDSDLDFDAAIYDLWAEDYPESFLPSHFFSSLFVFIFVPLLRKTFNSRII